MKEVEPVSRTSILITLLIAAAGSACSHEPAQPEAKPSVAAPVSPTPLVAEKAAEPVTVFGVETRNRRLMLLSTEHGERYRVEAKDGRVLADGIDETTLGRDYPELHELLFKGVDAVDIGGVDY